jgi:hypothetical protein
MVNRKPDAYWIEPGRLMAGEYPSAMNIEEVRPRLEKLFAEGIRSFLVHYQAQAEELGLLWRRIPIGDVSIPTRARMIEILMPTAPPHPVPTGHSIRPWRSGCRESRRPVWRRGRRRMSSVLSSEP